MSYSEELELKSVRQAGPNCRAVHALLLAFCWNVQKEGQNKCGSLSVINLKDPNSLLLSKDVKSSSNRKNEGEKMKPSSYDGVKSVSLRFIIIMKPNNILWRCGEKAKCQTKLRKEQDASRCLGHND